MVLSKGSEGYLCNFDFTDSIVEKIYWDETLLDLLIVVDYYWDIHEGKNKSRTLTIRFKYCLEASFTLPKKYYVASKDGLAPTPPCSWYTIVQTTVEKEDGLLKINVKTDYDDPVWLTIKCEDIWVEDELFE
jgi:hypothetical protein